jgi:CBS domain-containing membrane protein
MQTSNGAEPWRFFRPILPGATGRDRIIACVGAVFGIALTGLISAWVIGPDANIPLMVAPMGASAVLVFAVPASPLAQPWSTFGGNVVSAFMGVIAAKLIGEPMIAAGVAVGLAIGMMSLTRCLHPPGGAAAVTAVLGGPGVIAAGFSFPLVPVALNAALLVALGWGIHKLTRRTYPHRPAPPKAPPTADPAPTERVGFSRQDVDAALAEIGEGFDIRREDLDRLIYEVERRALVRAHGDLACAQIMSRDVLTVAPDTRPADAIALLIDNRVRLLPVVDAAGRVVGSVGLRELAGRDVADVGAAMSEPLTARPEDPAVALTRGLTHGEARAAVIVDAERRLLGLVTQTDLLAAMAHELSVEYRDGAAPKA